MKKVMVYMLLAMVSALPLSVAAQGMASVASPDEPHGLIISGLDMPAESIFSVNIKTIDGQEIPPFPSGVWLKPGQREIKGFGNVDANFARGFRGSRSNSKDRLEPLVIDVEAGMTYYVGLQAIGDYKDWKLVVWKKEPSDS
ncbi:MAG: hypothetical protein Tsb002_20270 [Wenzhouxiangellaceae bacterium]